MRTTILPTRRRWIDRLFSLRICSAPEWKATRGLFSINFDSSFVQKQTLSSGSPSNSSVTLQEMNNWADRTLTAHNELWAFGDLGDQIWKPPHKVVLMLQNPDSGLGQKWTKRIVFHGVQIALWLRYCCCSRMRKPFRAPCPSSSIEMDQQLIAFYSSIFRIRTLPQFGGLPDCKACKQAVWLRHCQQSLDKCFPTARLYCHSWTCPAVISWLWLIRFPLNWPATKILFDMTVQKCGDALERGKFR